MKQVNIKITYGIHIILNMYHILLSILSKNNDLIFNISINMDKLKEDRNDIDEFYLDKFKILVNEILKINNVYIHFNENYNLTDWATNGNCPYIKNEEISILKDNIFTKYKIKNIDISKPYICINTKITNSSRFFNSNKNEEYNFIYKYHLCKNNLFKILNNSNYNIVLLGEKNISDCKEYNFHKDNFINYIMYNDFKNNLNNIIDETYDNSADSYDINSWKKTCYYLTHSKFNVFIGNGGGIHLYSCFKNCIQLGVTDKLLTWIPKDNIETDFFNTIDVKTFLNKIYNKYLVNIISIPRSGCMIFESILNKIININNLKYSYCERYNDKCTENVKSCKLNKNENCKNYCRFVKNHDWDLIFNTKSDKNIVILRKDLILQLEAIYRHFNQKKKVNYLLKENQLLFKDFIKSTSLYSKLNWKDYCINFHKKYKNRNDILLLYYEDLVTNKENELNKILNYLNLDKKKDYNKIINVLEYKNNLNKKNYNIIKNIVEII